MASYRYPQPAGSEITPRETYFGRRAFLAAGAGMAAGLAAPRPAEAAPLQGKPSPLSTNETQTPLSDVTSYNNFYEFGQDKEDPARLASSFHPRPWTLTIGGAVGKPKTWDMDALLKRDDLEERIYRMRCVEAWSMVIPWIGLPLGTLLREAEPTSSARYVAFESVLRPDELPGQREAFSLEWPYVEGLRLDEAMHPLALLAVGLYGETLPNQNGAPIRLVTPWKYGFKGIKSITKITLTDKQPETSWSRMAPSEYGFYANVNPAVDHPRWSQASERVIGKASLFGAARKPTLPFNGYGEQVASLYQGMDLRKFY